MTKRIPGIFVIVIVLIAVCMIVFRKKPEATAQSVRLPNGEQLTFLEATYGSNAVYLWGKDYQRSLYNLLPAKYKSWSHASVFSFLTIQTNDPVFWLKESGGALAQTLPMRVLDEFGCECDPQQGFGGRSVLLPNSQGTVLAVQLNSTYLRGKTVGLCIYDSEAQTNRIATFMLPGAVVRPVPELQPAIPPQQASDLAVQLTTLAYGFKAAPYLPVMSNDFYFSEAAFRITKNGVVDYAWFPARIKLTDSAGKTIKQGYRHEIERRNGEIVYHFESILDPAAGPLKLRVELIHETGFAPDDLITFTNVPFPQTKEIAYLQLTGEAHGQKVALDRVQAGYTERPSGINFNPDEPFIQAQFSPPTNSWHLLLVGATDESGNDLSRWGTAPMPKGKYCFAFAPTTKAKSMKLTFAVHQSRFVEFTATPMLIPTNRSNGLTPAK